MKRQSTTKQCKNLLKFVSIGQFDRGLYIRGKRFQSSLIGGIVTIIFAIFILTYAFYVFQSIIGRDLYRLDQSITDTKYSGLEQLSVENF